MKKIFLLSVLALFICSTQMNSQDVSSMYRIANKFPIEGDGNWDYLTVDDTTGNLFVTHGSELHVMEMKTGKVISTMKGFQGLHGVAFAENVHIGYVTNGRDSSCQFFDLNKFQTMSKIANVGQNPDAVVWDYYTQRVFTFNGRSNDFTAIDPTNYKIVKKTKLDGKPEFAVSDMMGKIYLNIEDLSMVYVIDASMMKVIAKYSLGDGKEPSGLALDTINHRIFSVCDNKLMVILDANTGKIITTMPIGDSVDGCAYDYGNKRIYASCGDGNLTIVQQVNADKYKLLGNLPTMKGARTISVSQRNHHIYIPAAERGDAPEPTAENPHPRPAVKPNTFVILDIEPIK